jgi:hypothetical protein
MELSAKATEGEIEKGKEKKREREGEWTLERVFLILHFEPKRSPIEQHRSLHRIIIMYFY